MFYVSVVAATIHAKRRHLRGLVPLYCIIATDHLHPPHNLRLHGLLLYSHPLGNFPLGYAEDFTHHDNLPASPWKRAQRFLNSPELLLGNDVILGRRLIVWNRKRFQIAHGLNRNQSLVPQLVDDQVFRCENDVRPYRIRAHAKRGLINSKEHFLTEILDLGGIAPISRDELFDHWSQRKHFPGKPMVEIDAFDRRIPNRQTISPLPSIPSRPSALHCGAEKGSFAGLDIEDHYCEHYCTA